MEPVVCEAVKHTLKESVTFSVIVPILPENDNPLVLKYLTRSMGTEENIEVIIAKGRQPSRQRNTAARVAKGDILVFFDDDSCPDPDFFERLVCHFREPEIAGVVGPNLALDTDKFIPNLVNAILTSRIGVLSKRSRYKSFGKIRGTSDSDLILCNFVIYRKVFLETGGLCEKLYPGEENEFFERFTSIGSGGTILYDPKLIVRRPRSESIGFFLKKICNYGKGRAHQFKCRKSLLSLVHMFGCMAFVLPIILILTVGLKSLVCLAALYGAVLLFHTFSCLLVHRRTSIALAIAPATVATHVSYVIGLWRGMLTPIVRSENLNTDVELEWVSLKGSSKTIGGHTNMETTSDESDDSRS